MGSDELLFIHVDILTLDRKTCDWLGNALADNDVEVSVFHAGKDSFQRHK